MPNVPISQLPAALPIQGDELVPIVQGGVTVRTTTSAISSSPNQNQTFLTVDQEPTLPNSRSLSANNGVTLVDGGAQAALTVELTGTALSLQNASSGLLYKIAGTVVPRLLVSGSSGISITNGDGVSGNPSVALSGRVLNFQNLGGSSGLVALTSGGVTSVSLQGTANQISVANGSGPGNPTISISGNPVIPGKGGMVVPSGTTAERPAVPLNGTIRYNTDLSNFEIFDGSWSNLPAGSVSLINTGTGLTGGPITSTGTISIANTGIGYGTYGSADQVPQLTINEQGQAISGANVNIELDASRIISGILPVDRGGSGANTLTGYLVGNGTSPFTAVTSIPSGDISGLGTMAAQNANSVSISGGSITGTSITLTNSLTFNNSGSGAASGSFYDGSASYTISYNTLGASPLAGSTSLITLGTITTGVWHGSTIDNAYLTNSSLTINGSSVSLGGSVTVTATASNALTFGTHLTGTSYNGSAPITIGTDATDANTVSTIVARDAGGNFSAGTITAALNGNAATATSATTATTATNLAGGAAGSIPYQTASGTTTFLSASTGVLVGGTTPSYSTAPSLTGTNFSSIPNGALSNSSVTIGTTAVSLGGSTLTLGGLTSVTLTQNPVSALQAATKQYVDSLYSQGINYHTPVKYEVPDTTGNLNAIYNQPGGPGVGVGATLTNNGTLGAFTPDGVTASIGDRILIYNQTNQYENGVYEVTVVGNGSTPWVLTRTSDTDTYGATSPTALGQGDAFFITSGNTGAGETYLCNTVGTITFGTTAITFTQISSVQVYSAGQGLTLTGTQFSLTSPVVTSLGGTGLSSYTTGDMVYYSTGSALSKLGIGASTYIMTSSGSAPQWTAPSGITVGNATNAVTATNATTSTNIAGGSAGAVPYNSASGTTTFLSLGTSTYIMTAGATAPQWSNPSGITVGNATNAVSATTATNVAGGSAGALVYNTGAGASTFLSLGTTNYVLTAGASAPQYVAQSTLSVGSAATATTATTATNVAGGSAGAIIYNSGAGTSTFLSLGTSTYILTAGASAPQYTDPASVTVGTSTNAVNVGTTATSTNTNFYIPFVPASTSGNQALGVDAGLKYNPSTNAITGGISGGTF